jgi:hypothetical protein
METVRSLFNTPELKYCHAMAKTVYHEGGLERETVSLENRITQAALTFFKLIKPHLSEETPYPLRGYNKCLGFTIVPRTKLVLIAISEDKNREKDTPLRQEFLKLIHKVNQQTTAWIFELTCRPSQREYLMLRSLSLKTLDVPLNLINKARARCAEVALAIALCKAGRFKNFDQKEVAFVTFGATLFNDQGEPLKHFEGGKRNLKYLKTRPIEVPFDLTSEKGWIDRWEPCEEHCKLYMKELLALSASGSVETSLNSPRSERYFENLSFNSCINCCVAL